MKRYPKWFFLLTLSAEALLVLHAGSSSSKLEEISRHRNLGKAFYENPVTHLQAVQEFKKALELSPGSARDRLNYGLALLRDGKTTEAVAELKKVQKLDPSLPHTWFNLGIVYKKQGHFEEAIRQFKQMIRLVPGEPASHYNLGVVYRSAEQPARAREQFEKASQLGPDLAGPHFQLYAAYQQAGALEAAKSEYKKFQDIKKRQAGSAIPEDLDWSIYSEIYDPVEFQPPSAADRLNTQLIFRDERLTDGIDPKTAGVAILDFNGDGRPDLIVWSVNGVKLFQDGSRLVQDSGVEGLKGVISIAAGDFNNDGFPDLCVLTENAAELYVNQKGKFQKLPIQLPHGKYSKAIWMDYDHDGDSDLFLFGKSSRLIRNNGAAGFSDQSADFPFVAGNALGGAAFRLDADGRGVDLVVAYQDRAPVIYRDRLEGKFEAVPLNNLPPGPLDFTAFDMNQDGWMDLAAVYPTGLRFLSNHKGALETASALSSAHGPVVLGDFDGSGAADFVANGKIFRNYFSSFKPLRVATPGIPAGVAAAVAPFKDDKLPDIVEVSPDGVLHLLRNETPTQNRWLRVCLVGVKNPMLGWGANVEVKAGSLYQEQTYYGVPLLFGLGLHKQADTIRITWPNGLIQNEVNQAAETSGVYKEAARLSGSCPMIFTWNGKKYKFITDVLGVAPLGASSGESENFPVNSHEDIWISGDSLAARRGFYDVHITEELHEVSYLDKVQLFAVDHPSNVEIFNNSKFKSPPFPKPRLFGVRRRISPLSARDERGRDVLAKVLKCDRAYPDAFQRNSRGVAEFHWIDLDFGKSAPNNRSILVLNGWVDWPDGSTFLAAAQEGKPLVLPYLQVKDAAGNWKTVIEDMGIPAGKPKTIVVDLAGKFISSSREIRIVTNLCVYWDKIFLSEGDQEPLVRMTPIDAEEANLHFRGFSKPNIDPARKQPEAFEYSHLIDIPSWNPTPGSYTRYGDVYPLVTSSDDRLVIMGAGDELRLRFSVRALPKVNTGWRRDFILAVDGWAKDSDATTAFSWTVEPLPFHGMSGYPYSNKEKFPDDETHNRYREQYNTRPALRLVPQLAGTYNPKAQGPASSEY